ncbi:MAG TPA: type II secretion system F family protein [Bryobacteraceae bacterium]|nr:type II secretion system F family protein [Bryobacteraceae bacterium]
MPLFIFALTFGAIFIVTILFVGFCFASARTKQNNQIRTMLRTADPVVAERAIALLRPSGLQDSFSRFLSDIGVAGRFDLLLEQAGSTWTSTTLVCACLAGGVFGIVLASQAPVFQYRPLAMALLGALGAFLPLGFVRRKRKKRLRKFEEQFPEALDFLSRSLRAGHAFSVGLEMLVVDSPEPLATLFRRVLNELHLGASLESALGKLVLLVPLVDVRFFVSSVLLQQETGGNLSEILNKLSDVIRDRFRIKGQVKAAAAHGKVTGMVLVVLPAVVAALMCFVSPGYLMILIIDPDGRLLIMGSILGQILGFFCIKKITDIKV